MADLLTMIRTITMDDVLDSQSKTDQTVTLRRWEPEFEEGWHFVQAVEGDHPPMYVDEPLRPYAPADVAVCQAMGEQRAYYFDSLEEAQGCIDTSDRTKTCVCSEMGAKRARWWICDRHGNCSATYAPMACNCGGKKAGAVDFGAGHSTWCDVHESRLP